LNIGKIISKVGDQVVIESTTNNTQTLKKTTYTSRGALGPVVDIIGRTNKPYLIVKPHKNVRYNVGDVVHVK
jgi:rRNA processing protein Gar1